LKLIAVRAVLNAGHRDQRGLNQATDPTSRMRANRMLNAPGVKPYDPAACGKAIFVPFAEVPQPSHYGLVATCHFSLPARVAEFGLVCQRERDEDRGGWH
jgi:hypothetical protein